jgi:hypothetical protein
MVEVGSHVVEGNNKKRLLSRVGFLNFSRGSIVVSCWPLERLLFHV